MSITEFIETVTKYLVKYLANKFSGKITITINAREGGIGSVQVSTLHSLTKDNWW